MTSRQKKRRRKSAAAASNVGTGSSTSSSAVATLGIAAWCAAGSANATPPLPTPCVGGTCGTSSAAKPFVTYGTAGASVSGTTMTVNQSSDRAILNWANFNIANGYKVNFVQPGKDSAALNNIWSSDPGPSHIAGQLTANGQVYLYNQNGIVFDNGAQVNVGGLVASTLRLPDDLFEKGILSKNSAPGNPGTQCGNNNNACQPAVFQGGPTGSVSVASGATLTTSDGGLIMLLAPKVTNEGTITTPGGQTILGAGNTVYLAASSDASLRGLLIEVNGNGTGADSTVTNASTGQITAARGNVTLAGFVVNQQGRITATTSVNANGSIYLVAGDTSDGGAIAGTGFYLPNPKDAKGNETAFGGLLPNAGGTLTLAPGSVTEVQADSTDTATINQGNLGQFIPSQVDLVGKTVELQSNASIRAPGATVNVYASANPYLQLEHPATVSDQQGRIYLDSGSSIDVSGLTEVPVSVTRNLVDVRLQANDLQDDPLLRDGFLHGQTVTIDVDRTLPRLFSAGSYVNNIGLGISEVLTKAGTIGLRSNGDVITRAGSTLNVSGGSVAYQGGFGHSTTKLIGADGKVYDIGSAPNNIQYVGLASSYSYTDPTWGTKTSASASTYYAGYTKGKDAGEIDVAAPNVYLRGSMLAQTVAGPYQRSPSTLAKGGSLVFGCLACTDGNAPQNGLNGGVTFSDAISDDLAGDVTSATNLPPEMILSPTQLSQSGFNTLNISTNGGVSLPAGTTLKLVANGNFTVIALQPIEVDGKIDAPGGVVSLNTALNAAQGLPYSHVDVRLGPDAVIDVSGRWTNDSPLVTTQPGTAPTVINGGTVNLSAFGDVLLSTGSIIDVSGGGWINNSNKLTAGDAGTITLSTNYRPNPNVTQSVTGAIDLGLGTTGAGPGATLLGASLSGAKGGTLSISSSSVTVGWTPSGTTGELFLTPDFFNNRGFSSYNITGQNGVIIGSADPNNHDSVRIAPVRENRVFTGRPLLQPTGTDIASFTTLQTLPQSLRSPVSLSFAATATERPGTGNILLSQNAIIDAEPGKAELGGKPGANVTLSASATGDLTVLGSIIAPAGNITLQIGDSGAIQNASDADYLPGQQLLLGPHSLLASPAYALIDTLDPQGYREGSVLPGGTVWLQAYKGYVVTEAGSQIDVNGAAGIVDVVQPTGVTPTTVAGNAGAINIDAREGIALLGSLHGEAASSNGTPIAGAGGGSLSIGLDLYNFDATYAKNDPATAATLTLDRTLTLSSESASSLSPALQRGSARITARTIQAGSFDSIAVKSSDILALDGTFSLSAKGSLTLDAPLLQGVAGASVSLSASHVSLGNYYNQTGYFTTLQNVTTPENPAASTLLNASTPSVGGGTATLAVTGAQLIDIRGQSGWIGFATGTLSSSGDIRFTTAQGYSATPGVYLAGLNTSADLTFQAAQVYPTTLTSFTINTPGSATIERSAGAASAAPATPLSAGGSVTINALSINQNGVLRAPLGDITLNGVDAVDAATGKVTTAGRVTLASGSLTSVSADGLVIPYGSTSNGLQWTYTAEQGFTNTVSTPPAKQITITGSNTSVNSGAKVDLSGGGDLYAYEFVAGPGGSKDVLNPANSSGYTYAIVPSLGSSFAPLDQQYQLGSKATRNQTIHLSGIPGLADGDYALLPAYYALLPGAYAVKVVTNNSDIVAGSVVKQPDGSYVSAARFGVSGTDVIDSRTSTILISPGTVVRTQSQYLDGYANTFFSSAAVAAKTATPSLPADAGQLTLSGSNMTLAGNFKFDAGSYVSGKDSAGNPVTHQGLGGGVSILASNIVVADCSSSAAATCSASNTLYLDPLALDNFHAQTLVLGATLANTTAGEQVTISTSTPTHSVTLEKSSTSLTGPEIIFAATDQVVVDDGAQIRATGAYNGSSAPLVVQGAGALLRISSGGSGTLKANTKASPKTPGLLSIGSASLTADGSLQLYTTHDLTLKPDAAISAANLGLYSNRVLVGDAPASAAGTGLDLNSQLLSGLGSKLTGLTIGSSTTIDFYGNVKLGTSDSASPGLQSLTLDAQGLAGYGTLSGGTTPPGVTLQANTVTFANSTGNSPLTSLFTGSGGSVTLQVLAKSVSGQSGSGQITLGAGDKTISGFGAINLQADGDIVGLGGALNIVNGSAAVPLSLTSSRLVVARGADQHITTAGSVTIASSRSGANATLPAVPIGGSLTIDGSDITQNGIINMPAGNVTLHATGPGGVTLGGNSLTGAAGVAKLYYDTSAVAPGGRINLVADSGNVIISSGATVDVSGATSADGKTSGDAGTLSVSAPQGQFTFAGTIKGGAATGQLQGNFTLDVSSLGDPGFSGLNKKLSDSGFAGAIRLRTRSDSSVAIASTDTVQASSFELEADKGTIDVAGTINTSGGNALNTNGGAVSLWAGTGLTLEHSAVLKADAGAAGPTGIDGSAKAAHGGDVVLGTASGNIDIQAFKDAQGKTHTALVSMLGGGGSDTDGTLTLRAPQTSAGKPTADGANVQITSTGLEVQSRKPVIIEGVRTYKASALGGNDDAATNSLGIAADPSNTLYADALNFINTSSKDAAALRLTTGDSGKGQTGVQVRPEIEVDSVSKDATVAGDLQLTSNWDLGTWSAQLGVPVDVTLRAAGNLVFNASLSDGFTSAASTTLAACSSGVDCTASYRLTAGADLSAASPLAVIAQPVLATSTEGILNSGNVIVTQGSYIAGKLSKGNLIRTGDGNIAIAAGGDVLLGYAYGNKDGSLQAYKPGGPLASVIYTAGIASTLTPEQAALFTAPSGSYATNGGNITVTAADDVRSVPSAQIASDWLWRRGTLASDAKATPTWWIMFNNFRQGIGALGGGDISLSAGRDIVNVSAVSPTTGRLIGAGGNAKLILAGGGNLSVQAGGDIKSGVFEADWGNALVRAGGALNSGTTLREEVPTADPDPAIYPILLLGSGTFDVSARADVTINMVGNSTVLPELNANRTATSTSTAYFYTYGSASTLNVLSAGGNVTLNNTTSNLPVNVTTAKNNPNGYETNSYTHVYPPTLNVAALSGDIDVSDSTSSLQMYMFPSATGNLNLLAAQNITSDPGVGIAITMLESDPTLVANPFSPSLKSPNIANYALTPLPLHQNDDQLIHIVADSGNISRGTLIFPKAAEVIAGGNITDLTYTGKNLRPSDVTLIEAGGDITYTVLTDSLTNKLVSNGNVGVRLGGPGYLEVLAGGTINLGNSIGLDTNGSLNDVRLPRTGATLVTGAGFGTNSDGSMRQPAYQSFIDTYLAPDSKGNASSYADKLVGYVENLFPTAEAGVTYPAALTQFEGLSRAQQLPLLSQVLTDELSATGLAHTLEGKNYDRGYTAINTLFPTKDSQGNSLAYKGDLDMFFSSVKTEQGGDIDLLVPGGSVVVGLANPPGNLEQVKGGVANLGLLVLGNGAIQGFADQSFTVNQSRILTLEGGDIILWASNGDIDAGRGAKSASAAPPPTIQTSDKGVVSINASNAVVGSGIGQLVSTPGVKPGLVNLIAPKGAVNAGDAGIRVAGNLNLAAQVVIGAGNITVGGTATGVPVSEAGALSGALSGANALGDAGKNAVDQLSQNLSQAASFQQMTDDLQPTFIQVKMFCLGVECETH